MMKALVILNTILEDEEYEGMECVASNFKRSYFEKAIAELEASKSCNSCKYFDDDFRECGKTLDTNVPAYIDFMGCGLHQLKPTS